MSRNTESIEFEVWYVCIKLIIASDSQEIMKWLKRLELLTDTMNKDCLIDIENFFKYYSLHYDAK